MKQSGALSFARLLLMLPFFGGIPLKSLAQEQSFFPFSTTASIDHTEIPFQYSNAISWGIAYVASDKGNIPVNGFPGLGLQFSTSFARQVSSTIALEASCNVMSSSFALDMLGTVGDTTLLSASIARQVKHAMTTTISGSITPFEQDTPLAAFSCGGGVSLRWSGVVFYNVLVAPNQQYRLSGSLFAHSLALGGHLFVGYTLPVSHNASVVIRAFTDIFLPPRYIIEDRVTPAYGVALQQLRSPLFIGSGGNDIYQYGGTIGLSAIFRVHF